MENYKIAVAGTGYVGLSLSVLLAQHNQVMAVDIVQAKVDMINNHKSPIQDDYIYLVGAKSLGAYGGYETFVYKLTEHHQNKENIKYHVACKANGDGCMDETKFDGVTKINDHEFELHNAHCFKIDVPQIGPAQAIYYDVAALKACCDHIKKNHIPHPIVYIMACRIGPFAGHFYHEIHKLGGTVYLNPDGHEWMRAKWSAPIRKYWKISEQMMVKYCDLAICDSVNIEKYIHECYDGKGIKGRNPKTTFIAYGADLTLSKLADDDEKLVNWYKEKGLTKKDYYLVVGRFVPENSFEVMIREFMKSGSKKDFALITNGSTRLKGGEQQMIGTYYRLSLTDEDVGADKAESNSIQGQRGLVEGYIMARPELATEPRQEYVDDGYSGASTSRPAFQRLIQDAQDGKAKTIIVKDFSRFARDYIEAGDYMERIFPLLGVRFISVNDGYDSGMQIGNDVRGLEVAIRIICKP